MRETRFSIVKALAIICVVLSHAGAAGWVQNFVYLFHVPVFFICAGYFFHTRYLEDERTFIVRRIRGLYLPYLRWSIFFLIVHNLLFPLGILSETYGNAGGGVTHPYDFTQFSQHLASIVFNMSGHDQFLCGAFWFFRALLLASVGFLILFKLLKKLPQVKTPLQVGWGMAILIFVLLLWKVGSGVNFTGIAQGGYRELMGMFFMACGFLIRQYDFPKQWWVYVGCLAVLVICSVFTPTSMAWRPDFKGFITLPLPAVCGFFVLVGAAGLLDKWGGWAKNALVYVGDRTLYVFAFHLVAFKVAGMVKIAWYGLPWDSLGGHPYVLNPSNNWFFVLVYVLLGVALPLGVNAGWQKLTAHCKFTSDQVWQTVAAGAVVAVRGICMGAFITGHGIFKGVCLTGRGIKHGFQSLVQAVKDIIDASSTKDE